MQTTGRATKAAGALTTSVSVHAGLLVLFAAIRFGIVPDKPLDTISAGFAETEQVESVVTLPQVANKPTDNAGSLAAAPILTEAASEPLLVDTIATEPAVEPSNDESTTPEVKTIAKTTRIGQGAGNAVGDGAGDGGSFFDVESAGNRVVYVVDCSKSMKRRFPSKDKTRFARVKRELIESISSLKPEQKFFVIYFNTEAFPMPGTRLVPRDSYDVPRYLKWLATFPPDGRTNPEDALIMALRLKPDAVFFLTDGAFRPNIVDNVVAANALNVPIHAIGFGDEVVEGDKEALDTLTSLATRSGGHLTLISDNGTITRQ